MKREKTRWTAYLQQNTYAIPKQTPGLLLITSLVLHFLVVSVTPGWANETLSSLDNKIYSSPGEVKQGELLITQKEDQYTALELNKTDVNIQISGMISTTTVRQEFINNDQNWLEGIYVFPLPDESSVHMLKMHIGERVINGEIHEKKQARSIYQQAKKEGKKTTLVEQERPNIFTATIANIGPGEKVIVEIGYQEIVSYRDGTFSIRFPMVVGPRYIPGTPNFQTELETINVNENGWALNTDQVPDASRITPPVRKPDLRLVNQVNLSIDLSSGIPLESVRSLYHSIHTDKKTDDHFLISFTNTVWADRDFVLEWLPKIGSEPQAALFTEYFKGEHYALLMLMPPGLETSGPELSRDVIFVLDVSGSMAGPSLKQAKNALTLAISRLKPKDRFKIIFFNDKARAIFPKPLPADRKNINHAIHSITKLQAQGGTNIKDALKLALDGHSRHERIRQVIFLTDGSVGNEDDCFGLIQKRLGDSRLFTVGIGSAPNSFFMTRAAEFGRGTFTYIGKVSEVQEKMDGLFTRLNSQSMTDVYLENESGKTEQYPERIPDMYAAEPLLASLQLNKMPKELTVRGNFDGQVRTYKIQTHKNSERQGVARFWARKKIRSLMNQLVLAKEKAPVQKNVLETALHHKLVSRYTSLVAVEQKISRPQEASLLEKNIEVNLPHGWQYNSVFGGNAKTATPAKMFRITGIILLCSSVVLILRSRKKALR